MIEQGRIKFKRPLKEDKSEEATSSKVETKKTKKQRELDELRRELTGDEDDRSKTEEKELKSSRVFETNQRLLSFNNDDDADE